MLKSNIDYFNLMINKPEALVEMCYADREDVLIIPETKNERNELTKATDDLYRFIDVFETLSKELKNVASADVFSELLEKTDAILMTVKGINFCSFCQYFMVKNISHSLYSGLEKPMRLSVLNMLMGDYIKRRHHIYKSHGYTPVVLQTMCDNYSHKRKGKVGIAKIEKQLKKMLKITDKTCPPEEPDCYYLEPDKSGKKTFENVLKKHNVLFRFRKTKQGKLPDVLLKIKNEYYLIEHKSMKETGGGQDKQIAEVLDFIRYTEKNGYFHYVTYLDGVFSNRLSSCATGKNATQYAQIQNVLKKNPKNYFVNTSAFLELLNDLSDPS